MVVYEEPKSFLTNKPPDHQHIIILLLVPILILVRKLYCLIIDAKDSMAKANKNVDKVSPCLIPIKKAHTTDF